METIYQDSNRTLTVTPAGYLKIKSGRGDKSANLLRSFIDDKLPAGVPEAIRKIGEDPSDWYLLREGTPLQNSPIAAMPNITRPAVEAAIEKAKAEDAERKAAESAALAARDQAAREACPAGYVMARQEWSNGDLCAAKYITEDGVEVLASDLLTSHNGWYYLPAVDVDAARAEQQAKSARKAEAKAAVEADRAVKIAEAKATGKPVVIRTWMTEDCTEHLDDCSFDHAAEVALPDGTMITEYTHCH